MPDIRLQRSDHKWAVRGAQKDGCKTVDLDRIADFGARAVALDVRDLVRAHIGTGQGLADNGCLAIAIGERDSSSFSVAA